MRVTWCGLITSGISRITERSRCDLSARILNDLAPLILNETVLHELVLQFENIATRSPDDRAVRHRSAVQGNGL